MSSISSRRRSLCWFRILLVALVLVLTGATLTACTAPKPVSTEAGSSVGSGGFSLRVKGATATAGAAVAPKGTSVTLADVSHTFLSRYSKDLAGLGSPVRLSLAKNRQPSAAITLRFRIDQSKVSKASWSSPRTFLVATQSAGSSTTILMPARYDSKTGELVVTTHHLSWFWPIQFNLGAFLGGVTNTLLEGLGVQFPKPDCSNNTQQVSYQGANYDVTGAWAVTPCLSSGSDALNLDLYSTTGIPFKVVSSPDASATALPGLAASGVLSTAVFETLFGEKGAKLLAPGGRLKYSYTGAAPRTLSFEEAPATLLVVILVNVAEAALPEASGAAQALSAMDKLDCMSQVADTAESASAKLSTEAAGRIVSAFISCAGQMMGGNLIWTLATAVPSLLVNDALGIVTSLAGQGSFTLNVASTPGPPVVGSGPVVPSTGAPDGTGPGWYYLSNLNPVQDDGPEGVGAENIAGLTHPNSVDIGAWWGTSWALYNIGHVCSKFRATVGTIDSSPTSETSHNVVQLDGKQIIAVDTPIGTAKSIDVSITGGFRLKIASSFPSQRSFQDVGWGDAEVYCASHPQ